MSYDFSQLNDKEFENIVTDLLSLEFNTRIERFRPGRDSGVDGRFFSDVGKEHVVQCKHYLKSGYNKLKRTLNNVEKVKVDRLKPEDYYIVTSVPLSRKQKREIQEIFKPYLKIPSNVYGQEDLNQLLGKYPDIENRHYKLWLASTNVLSVLLNRAITGRSKFELERIRLMSKRFVDTDEYHKARKMLAKNRVIIISGEPGIGKTTIAGSLCLTYAAQGFEFVVIEESVSEAEAVFEQEKQQVFYFDDFLGSNYLEAIENKRDSHIMNFIERVRLDPTKRFVLTSRTNILRQGIECSPVFHNRKLDTNELLLNVNELRKLDKARILYNHLWFGALQESYIDKLYKDKRYHKVIEHKNFNPRLIEFITDPDRIVDVTPEEYWEYLLSTFRNPKDVWENCFKYQSNTQVRALVVLIAMNGGEIIESDLREAYSRYLSLENIVSNTNLEINYNTALSMAIRTFIDRYIKNNEFAIQLFNPSISDYILGEYKDLPSTLKNAFLALGTLNSLYHLEALCKEKILDKDEDELANMYYDSINTNKSIDYQLRLAETLKDHTTSKPQRKALVYQVLMNPQLADNYTSLLNLLNIFWGEKGLSQTSILNGILAGRYLKETEIQALLALLRDNEIEIDIKMADIIDQLSVYICAEVYSRASSSDMSSNYSSGIGSDGEFRYELDSQSAYDDIYTIAEMLVEEIGINSIDGLELDLDRVLDDIDVYEICSSPEYDTDDYWDASSITIYESDIDDLFERT